MPRTPTPLVLLLILFLALPVHAAGRRTHAAPSAPPALEQDIRRDFEQILDLWRDGRYDELYLRIADGREGKESFARKLAAAPRRPACCWEKMQEVQVSLKGDKAALLKARLGFEGSVSGTEYETKGIRLKNEGGVWTVSQSDLFSLAQVSRKKPRYKYLPIQPK